MLAAGAALDGVSAEPYSAARGREGVVGEEISSAESAAKVHQRGLHEGEAARRRDRGMRATRFDDDGVVCRKFFKHMAASSEERGLRNVAFRVTMVVGRDNDGRRRRRGQRSARHWQRQGRWTRS